MNRERTPSEGFSNLFGPQAARYTEARPRYPRPLFHYLAVAARGTRVAWDCATGNGQAAVGLAERFTRVVATDASADMIAKVIPHPRVAYHVAKYDSKLPDRSANLVAVAQALHWLELDPFLDETRRVLVPGGVLAAWCYSLCRIEPRIDEIVRLFHEVTLGPFWRSDRRLVEEGYRSIALPLEEMAPPPLEMVEDWTMPQFVAYVRTWSGVANCVAARGEEPVRAFEAALRERWGMPMLRREIRWPLHFRIGRVR
ncbi:MAG TPA: class I SAM-dependent methyltransferase [Gemmatimonadaceae bacterium]|nr:class I SAM-dependent methyltransferase [Gemmatimonadaceae bacterium]